MALQFFNQWSVLSPSMAIHSQDHTPDPLLLSFSSPALVLTSSLLTLLSFPNHWPSLSITSTSALISLHIQVKCHVSALWTLLISLILAYSSPPNMAGIASILVKTIKTYSVLALGWRKTHICADCSHFKLLVSSLKWTFNKAAIIFTSLSHSPKLLFYMFSFSPSPYSYLVTLSHSSLGK